MGPILLQNHCCDMLQGQFDYIYNIYNILWYLTKDANSEPYIFYTFTLCGFLRYIYGIDNIKGQSHTSQVRKHFVKIWHVEDCSMSSSLGIIALIPKQTKN